MGITVRACNLMMESAARHRRILSVAENYRRDPMNRLVRSLLDHEAIGAPYFMMENHIGGGNKIIITPWRHLKDRSGIIFDAGVHNADILSYFMGDASEVYATARLYEKVRYKPDKPTQLSQFYERTNKNMPDSITATMEDSAFGVVQFRSGAVGHWTLCYAGHGRSHSFRGIYGSRGSIFAPGDRSGSRVRLYLDDGEEEISDEKILGYVPDFKLDELTSKLFSAQRLHEYKMPFPETDRKLIALEIHELARSIRNGTKPEVDGIAGRRGVALIYALLESSVLNRPVKIEEVESENLRSYQEEIDKAVGIE
jgi:predicted dehydrogenase